MKPPAGTTLQAVQERLGHRFTDLESLGRALTHASVSKQNYERLEFLGDRVLGLCVAEWLCERQPRAEEGEMAKILAAVVSRDSLAAVARRLDLGSMLRLSPGDAASGGRDNPALLADSCEAVIAALFLDGGLEAARRFVRREWGELIDAPRRTGDAKTQLQEWSQARGLGLPRYVMTAQTGLDHAPLFTVEVTIAGQGAATGTGPSKREAERAAAEIMCRDLGATS